MLSAVSRKIIEYNKHRLRGMLKVKYDAMAENVFRFYRGTCHLFYEEIAKANLPAAPVTWICGDLHLENFGSYKAENKLVYFDLNDFDEAVLAPALWEVVRILTSIYLAFEVLEIEKERAANMVLLFVRTYANTLSNGKAVCIDPRTSKGIIRSFLGKAKRSRYLDLLNKRTEQKKAGMYISLKDERHSKIKKTLRNALKEHMQQWIKTSWDGPFNYKVIDVVFRLAGTGSLGVKRYLFLLKSTNAKDKYLLNPRNLQSFVKEACGHEKFTSIESVNNDGKDIIGNFHTESWGDFKTYFNFTVNAEEKFSRLDIGQAK